VGVWSELGVLEEADETGAGEETAESEVCFASEGAKWMLITAGSEAVAVRSMVMGTAGLWYFRRTSSWRQNFLQKCRVSNNVF
jgi:hypothetical protein